MREILFRGKSIDNGEWVQSSFIMIDKEKDLLLNEVELFDGEKWRAVDPETVGEFTGLTDNNGKKIFEGDIIICDISFYGHVTGIVEYSNEACCFYIEAVNSSNDYLFNGENISVLGNIYDNPELLEAKS